MSSLYARLEADFLSSYDAETGILDASFDREKVSRLVYPDATIDAGGRAHAPCDGYLCRVWIPIQYSDGLDHYEEEREYSAGEFLPMNYEMLELCGERPFSKAFEAKQRRAKWASENAPLIEQIETLLSWSSFAMDVLDKAKQNCAFTPRQAEAIDKMLTKAKAKISEPVIETPDHGHFGAIGDRATVQVTVELVREFEGVYGPYFIATLRTNCGKELTYKGGNPPISWPMAEGGSISGEGVSGELSFTVKHHTDYKGHSQTIINRPRCVGVASN